MPNLIYVTVILDMDEIAQLRLCFVMHSRHFYVLNIMTTVCVKKQCNNRNRMVWYDIKSTSTRTRKQWEYLNWVDYESDIKCGDKLRMDHWYLHNLCQLLTDIRAFEA